jgi:putative transposase
MNYLEYKAENADRKVIFVNPKNTTQRCSQCGEIVKKELSDRTHDCPYCKISLDRDYNASLNILKAGVGHSSAPIELKPLFSYTSKDVVTGQVLAMT